MNLDKYTSPTIDAIYEHYVAARKDEHRPHMGGSQIGHHCDRFLWYQFRWAGRRAFEGRILRLFETGDREEIRLVRNLRDVDVKVWEFDEAGKQFNYTTHGGHFGLSLDGVGLGFIEAPKTAHVLEFKTANDKSFNKMKKDGLKIAHPQYYAQVQVGMYLAELDRAFFFMVNKNTDAIYGERIKLDKPAAEKLLERAGDIIFSETPPPKIAETDDWYQCKATFCDYCPVCQRGHIPQVNCRTCAHSTPLAEGGWSCQVAEYGQACSKHLYRPDMMPWVVEDAGDDFVQYQDGPRNFENSEWIYEECQP